MQLKKFTIPMIKTNFRIIYFSMDNWRDYFKRTHHFTRQISNLGIDTIYVEAAPPIKTRISFLIKNFFSNFSEFTKVNDHLSILTIYLMLPYHASTIPTFFKILIVYFNKLLWGLVVKKYLRAYTADKNVFIINSIFTFPDKLIESELQKFKHNIVLTVYDCVDVLEEFPFTDRKMTQYWEKKAVSRSDLVFVSAQALAERPVMKNAKSIHFIPNGVEFERFAQACKNPVIPNDIKIIKQHNYYLLGYVGSLAEWIDFKLLEELVDVNKNVILCIIGSCISREFEKQFKKITKSLKTKYGKRFQYLGPKPYREIPYYINTFDFCLIPFKPSQLIYGVNPIKLYEYLACGKGIISTYWKEISQFEDIIFFIRNDGDIKEAIQKEIQRIDDTTIKKRRLEIARSYDWINIVKSAWQIITDRILKNNL